MFSQLSIQCVRAISAFKVYSDSALSLIQCSVYTLHELYKRSTTAGAYVCAHAL
jgi:hypothetical protein